MMQIHVRNQDTVERLLAMQIAPNDGAMHAVMLKFSDTSAEALEAALQYVQKQGREILDYKFAMGSQSFVNLVITYK